MKNTQEGFASNVVDNVDMVLGNRELAPKEIIERLLAVKERYCVTLIKNTGLEILFPQNTVIDGIDVSGQSLEIVLDNVIAKLDTYEPPLVWKDSEIETGKEKSDSPVWLEGHENLMWNGANDNPLWEAKAKQHKNEVSVYFERREIVLRPGKDEKEQQIELDNIKYTFTLDEWKILNKVFDKYTNLEKQLDNDDEEVRRIKKRKLFEVVKEENAYRNGSGQTPEIIKREIEEIITEVADTTRGFKKDSIDVETLSQSAAELLSQLLVLNRTRGDGKEKIPRVKADIKEIPSFVLNLKKLVECFSEQTEMNKGMTLMVGEAGTGKNVSVEYFAANTHRPFYWFPCGRGMESIDLVAHYEFTSEEGTKRFLTDLDRGLQTPGAVVMIDEVNSLKPEVQAMLHGLGDSNRTLKYDGINIPVAKDVLIVLAGNPATYGSAGNLGEALLSRTRGQSMTMEYPALKKGQLTAREENWSDSQLEMREQQDNTLNDYACDEALVLYSQMNEFSGLNDQEFSLLWDVVINETTQGSKIIEISQNEKLEKLLDGVIGEHVRKILTDMRDILKVADVWRRKFENKEGGFDIIGVSIRDTIALVRKYKQLRDVRKAYFAVADDFKKDPIDGLNLTYTALDGLLNDVLGHA